MLDFTKRCYQPELLDDPAIPFEDIRLNMQELEFINTRLGGHAITLSGVIKLMGNRKRIHICEIGCGGGDNLKAIEAWCLKRGVDVSFTGIDIKDTCIRYAEENTRTIRKANFICSDYKTAVLTEQPDIIFSSLFCHHFTDEQVNEIIRWKYKNASLGFFINDLHRHPMAYHSIRILSLLFSSSYLVKHDAPLSVRRGFSRKDWKNIINDSRKFIPALSAEIHWKWAFRWSITVNK
jgi:2-polyprenyl-3-methyl-5-hydroxy-6-metoxy-1,4-benzoquinol methylase